MRFAAADKVWKNLMKASVETKNVVQVRSLRYTDGVVVQTEGRDSVCVCVCLFQMSFCSHSAAWEMMSRRLLCFHRLHMS